MGNVEYHRVLAGEHRRVGRGILAIFLVVGGMTLFTVVLAVAANAIDERGADNVYTPMLHAAGMIAVALLIPWSMLVQRWLYGVPGPSLHSVLSRFRFALFGRAVLIVAPVWIATHVALSYLAPEPEGAWTRTDALWMFAVTLMLMPLQATGEEYGFRGLIFRVVGSWTRSSRAGLILGLLVTTVAFMVPHLATDMWLNSWYFVFGITAGLITWRTGGLEVAIVLHALFNAVGFAFSVALRTDFSVVTDRAEGAGNAATLLHSGVMIVALAIVWLITRRTGPVKTPA